MSTTSTEVPNVLIVEDEMMLRMRAVDIVEDAGFHSVEAVNADEAMSILESRSDISLLFTDIQMPGSMDGLKLAHTVHNRWPDIKIILVSGQVKPSEAERPADSRFFGKPLGMQQMITELQTMVGDGALKIVPSPIIPPAEEIVRTAAPVHAGRMPIEPPLSAHEAVLSAENDSLRVLLEQAGIDAKVLLAQAGIDAKEREAADKLQKLILGELHHRIKNTLATVSAIASQSFRAAPTHRARAAGHGGPARRARPRARSPDADQLVQCQPHPHLQRRDRAVRKPGRPALSFQRAGYQDYLGRGHCAGDDVQRALHQHHEIRRALGPDRPRRNRLDDRRRKAAAAPDLDRKRRPAGHSLRSAAASAPA